MDGLIALALSKGYTEEQLNTVSGRIDALESIGRFLSVWNAKNHTTATTPPTTPYNYRTGDYYRVGECYPVTYNHDIIIEGKGYDESFNTVDFGVRFIIKNNNPNQYDAILRDINNINPNTTTDIGYYLHHQGYMADFAQGTGITDFAYYTQPQPVNPLEVFSGYYTDINGDTVNLTGVSTIGVRMQHTYGPFELLLTSNTGTKDADLDIHPNSEAPITITDTVTVISTGTNYQPTGTSYDASNYSTYSGGIETGDLFVFDGTSWVHHGIHQEGRVSDVQIEGTSIVNYGIANIMKVPALDYVTVAPTAANTNGIKIAVLNSDPDTKYDGWLYFIKES